MEGDGDAQVILNLITDLQVDRAGFFVLGIETMMILTGVSRVAIDFGKLQQRELERPSVSAMRAYLADGQFSKGSMGPKVEAAIRFIEGGGRRAIIAHLEEALPALRGDAGGDTVGEVSSSCR